MDTRSQPWSISALAQEITRTDLPTNMEVVRHSYHVINRLQTEDERFLRKVPDFADYKNVVLDDLFELWARANVPLNNRTTAETKLKKLCKDFRDRVKAAKRRNKKLFDILHLRDYILAFQQEDEEMVAMIKPYFMRHAVTWVGGQNLAINAFSNDAPFSVQDLLNGRQRLPRSIPTEEYLWQPRSIREFYVQRTKDAWCLRSATPSFWRSIDNHNRTCERYNGYLGKIFERKTINDFETEEDRPTVDRRFRGFMINLGKKLGPNRS